MKRPLRNALLVLLPLLGLTAPAAALDAPANAQSLPEVNQLMTFIDGISGKQVLSGQYELPDWFGLSQEQEFDYLLTTTGKLPAVRGFDLMFYSLSSNRMQRVVERAIQWHKRGGIVTFCFHMNMPGVGGDSFYVKSAAGSGAYTNFDVSKAATPGTAEYNLLIERLDIAAAELAKLRDARVPVIWRPFHECSGGWFWWGAKTAADFKAVWHLMYERFTTVHGLNNLIWCFNPTGNSATDLDSKMQAWYPGDSEVDMISLDVYPSTHAVFADEYKKMAAFKGGKKLIGMSENGRIPDVDTMFASGANWTWFATWYRDFITSETNNSKAFLNTVYNHAKVITLDELPALFATKPVVTVQPKGGSTTEGSRVVLSACVLGGGPLTYQWKKDGVALSGGTAESYTVASASTADSGAYTLEISNQGGTTITDAANVNVSPLAGAALPTKLVNLSSRAKVGTGGNVLIAGFSIAGTGSKRVLIRGVGPTLHDLAPSLTTLSDPYLAVYASDGTPILANNDWELDDKATIKTVTPLAGAFGLKENAFSGDNAYDSALVATLPAGNYTAILSGFMGAQGIALVEVYDLDLNAAARLGNLSSRGFVGTGVDEMVAGFVLQGGGEKKFLIRAVGPTLGLSPFLVPDTLSNPFMRLYDNKNQVVASNDNWADGGAEVLAALAASAGAFPLPTGSLDSVLGQTFLVPEGGQGQFTANVTGVDGATGAALMEIYEAP